ncbi:hypothetical protein ACWD5V_00720 [Streptomyces sp. NPDC002523]
MLATDVLRVRHGVHTDLRIPLAAITTVRRETRISHERTVGELDLAVGSQTSVTLELPAPVTQTTVLGRRREASVVRFHADDAATLVRELTRARTGSSSSPAPRR